MVPVADSVELVKRAQDGDDKAMSEIITIYKPLVYTIAYRLLNDPDQSKDITQETFVKAMMSIGKLQKPEYLKTWLCIIARNLAYDYLRKSKKESTIPLDEADVIAGKDCTASQRRSLIIQDALARLGERDRVLLTLAYYQDMSLKEVAEVTHIPLANVKVYLCRARTRLRKQLRGYEHEFLSV